MNNFIYYVVYTLLLTGSMLLSCKRNRNIMNDIKVKDQQFIVSQVVKTYYYDFFTYYALYTFSMHNNVYV